MSKSVQALLENKVKKMKLTKPFGVHIGAMAPKISAQLKDHGEVTVESPEMYDKLFDSLLMLYLNDVIPQSQYGKSKDKILKRLIKNLKKVKAK